MVDKNLVIRIVVVGWGLLLVASGFWIGRMSGDKTFTLSGKMPVSMNQLRGNYGKYTNPLLMCDFQDEFANPQYEPLKVALSEYIEAAKKDGLLSASVYFRDLSRGTSFIVNPDTRYIPASFNKVPLMMQVFERAEKEPTFLASTVVSHNSTDANAAQLIKPSASMKAFASYTMEEAVRLMILYSDNNAYNAITKQIPYSDYLSLFKELKIPVDTNEGVTVNELSFFLRVLYNSTVLSKEMSEKALALLTQTEYMNGLRAGVPAEVEVAHKFGTSGSIGDPDSNGELQLHDCGIVYAPDKPYLLCVMTKGKADIGSLETLIGTISKLVYESVFKTN